MQKMRPAMFAAAIATLALAGCATKDYVNDQVAAEDAKSQAANQATQMALRVE